MSASIDSSTALNQSLSYLSSGVQSFSTAQQDLKNAQAFEQQIQSGGLSSDQMQQAQAAVQGDESAIDTATHDAATGLDTGIAGLEQTAQPNDPQTAASNTKQDIESIAQTLEARGDRISYQVGKYMEQDAENIDPSTATSSVTPSMPDASSNNTTPTTEADPGD